MRVDPILSNITIDFIFINKIEAMFISCNTEQSMDTESTKNTLITESKDLTLIQTKTICVIA